MLVPSFIYDIKNYETDISAIQSSNYYFKLGFGVGLAIPLNENLSMSPAILYNWAFNDKWDMDMIDTNNEQEEIVSNYTSFTLEVRFHYKFERY